VLVSTGIVSTQQEADGVRRVLDAAVLTYVAAAGASFLQLIDLVLRQRESEAFAWIHMQMLWANLYVLRHKTPFEVPRTIRWFR
jgi:hypothetical protein